MTTHAIIQTLTERITSECKPVDREAAFDAMLDESGPVNVAGLSLMPSEIWKNCDETAYRCGVNDYADGEAWVEIDGDTYDQSEVEAIIEEFKRELEAELSDLERELEELLQDDDYKPETDEENELRGSIQLKQAEIAAVEADPFFS